MSNRLERIKSHQVWSQIDELRQVLAEVSRLDSLDPYHLSEIDRFNKALGFIATRLRQTDQSLVALSSWDNLNNQLAAARSNLHAYQSDRGPQYIEQASSQMDAALTSASQQAAAISAESIELLNEESSKYFSLIQEAHEQSRRQVQAIRQMASEIDDHFKKLASDFVAIRSSAENLLKDQERLFADAQTRRGDEWEDSRRAIQSTLMQVIAEHQSQFSTSQESRNSEFALAQNNRTDQFASLASDYTRELQNHSRTYRENADKLALEQSTNLVKLQTIFEDNAQTILSRIEERREQVENLVGVIGDLGVTSGYKKAADGAKRSMWLWQFLTLVAFGVFIWFGHTAFLLTLSGSFSWPMFTGRALLTLAVASVAVYTGKQASNFFVAEKRNRKLALELEAIRPFISGLPIEQQHTFRIDIGKKTFGREEAPLDGEGDGTSTNLVTLNEVARFIERLSQLLLRRP